jgi:protein disulfide-isomerase A6
METLKSGGSTAYAELYKTAGALQDKYAEYYTKVGKKAEVNADYVSKELARLQGLIKKGGLAPEKLDDLVSRSNILTKFKDVTAGVAGKEEL